MNRAERYNKEINSPSSLLFVSQEKTTDSFMLQKTKTFFKFVPVNTLPPVKN